MDPTISKVIPLPLPGTLKTIGGEKFSIEGTNLGPSLSSTSWSLSYGNFHATDCVTVTPNTKVTCTSVRGAGKGLAVSFILDGLSSNTPTEKLAYTPPSLSNVNPSTGHVDGGTVITLTGNNFAPASLSSLPCTSAQFNWNNPTQYVCTMPPSAAAAASLLPLSVTVGGQKSSGSVDFQYYKLTTLSPRYGNILGGRVTFLGEGFSSRGKPLVQASAPLDIEGGSTISVQLVNETALWLPSVPWVVPSSHFGSYNSSWQGTLSGEAYFKSFASLYTVYETRVDEIDIQAGPAEGQTSVQLSGSFYHTSSIRVLVGEAPVTSASRVSSATIKVVMPRFADPKPGAGIVANFPIQASVDDVEPFHMARGPTDFLVYQHPIIHSFDPPLGPVSGGTIVTIRGQGFVRASQTERSLYCRFGDHGIVQGLWPEDAPASGTVDHIVCVSPPTSLFSGNTTVMNFDTTIEVSLNKQQFTSDSVRYTYYKHPILEVPLPKIGPQYGQTELRLSGNGYIDSGSEYLRIALKISENDTVVLKPTMLPPAPPQPANHTLFVLTPNVQRYQHLLQKTLPNGTITLIPVPLLVSLNGQQYSPVQQSVSFQFYPPPVVTSVYPKLIRQNANATVTLRGNFWDTGITRTVLVASNTIPQSRIQECSGLRGDGSIVCPALAQDSPGSFYVRISIDDIKYNPNSKATFTGLRSSGGLVVYPSALAGAFTSRRHLLSNSNPSTNLVTAIQVPRELQVAQSNHVKLKWSDVVPSLFLNKSSASSLEWGEAVPVLVSNGTASSLVEIQVLVSLISVTGGKPSCETISVRDENGTVLSHYTDEASCSSTSEPFSFFVRLSKTADSQTIYVLFSYKTVQSVARDASGGTSDERMTAPSAGEDGGELKKQATVCEAARTFSFYSSFELVAPGQPTGNPSFPLDISALCGRDALQSTHEATYPLASFGWVIPKGPRQLHLPYSVSWDHTKGMVREVSGSALFRPVSRSITPIRTASSGGFISQSSWLLPPLHDCRTQFLFWTESPNAVYLGENRFTRTVDTLSWDCQGNFTFATSSGISHAVVPVAANATSMSVLVERLPSQVGITLFFILKGTLDTQKEILFFNTTADLLLSESLFLYSGMHDPSLNTSSPLPDLQWVSMAPLPPTNSTNKNQITNADLFKSWYFSSLDPFGPLAPVSEDISLPLQLTFSVKEQLSDPFASVSLHAPVRLTSLSQHRFVCRSDVQQGTALVNRNFKLAGVNLPNTGNFLAMFGWTAAKSTPLSSIFPGRSVPDGVVSAPTRCSVEDSVTASCPVPACPSSHLTASFHLRVWISANGDDAWTEVVAPPTAPLFSYLAAAAHQSRILVPSLPVGFTPGSDIDPMLQTNLVLEYSASNYSALPCRSNTACDQPIIGNFSTVRIFLLKDPDEYTHVMHEDVKEVLPPSLTLPIELDVDAISLISSQLLNLTIRFPPSLPAGTYHVSVCTFEDGDGGGTLDPSTGLSLPVLVTSMSPKEWSMSPHGGPHFDETLNALQATTYVRFNTSYRLHPSALISSQAKPLMRLRSMHYPSRTGLSNLVNSSLVQGAPPSFVAECTGITSLRFACNGTVSLLDSLPLSNLTDVTLVNVSSMCFEEQHSNVSYMYDIMELGGPYSHLCAHYWHDTGIDWDTRNASLHVNGSNELWVEGVTSQQQELYRDEEAVRPSAFRETVGVHDLLFDTTIEKQRLFTIIPFEQLQRIGFVADTVVEYVGLHLATNAPSFNVYEWNLLYLSVPNSVRTVSNLLEHLPRLNESLPEGGDQTYGGVFTSASTTSILGGEGGDFVPFGTLQPNKTLEGDLLSEPESLRKRSRILYLGKDPGWFLIHLTQPLTWDGSSNLVLQLTRRILPGADGVPEDPFLSPKIVSKYGEEIRTLLVVDKPGPLYNMSSPTSFTTDVIPSLRLFSNRVEYSVEPSKVEEGQYAVAVSLFDQTESNVMAKHELLATDEMKGFIPSLSHFIYFCYPNGVALIEVSPTAAARGSGSKITVQGRHLGIGAPLDRHLYTFRWTTLNGHPFFQDTLMLPLRASNGITVYANTTIPSESGGFGFVSLGLDVSLNGQVFGLNFNRQRIPFWLHDTPEITRMTPNNGEMYGLNPIKLVGNNILFSRNRLKCHFRAIDVENDPYDDYVIASFDSSQYPECEKNCSFSCEAPQHPAGPVRVTVSFNDQQWYGSKEHSIDTYTYNKCRSGWVTPTFKAKCVPCYAGQYADADQTKCIPCPLHHFSAQNETQTNCTACPLNSFTSKAGESSLRDCQCRKPVGGSRGYFKLNDTTLTPCERCPNHAYCPGGWELPEPLPGYASRPEDPGTMIQCDPPDACPGGPGFPCASGYLPPLCNECSGGHYRLGGRCYNCDGLEVWGPVFLVGQILGVFFILVKITSRMEIMSKFGNLPPFLSHFDTILVLLLMRVNWPSTYTSFSLQYALRWVSFNAYYENGALECFRSEGIGVDDDHASFVRAYTAPIFTPFIWLVILSIYMAARVFVLAKGRFSKWTQTFAAHRDVDIWQGKRGGIAQDSDLVKDSLLSPAMQFTNATLFISTYSTTFIFYSLGQFLVCIDREDGVRVQYARPSVTCVPWTIGGGLAVFLGAVVALIPPVVCVWHYIRFGTYKTHRGALFLFKKYRKPARYWELVNFALKFLLVMVAFPLLNRSGVFQEFLVMCVVVVGVLLHQTMSPYKSVEANRLQNVSFAIQFFILFLVIVFDMPHLVGAALLWLFKAIGVLILVLHLVFFPLLWREWKERKKMYSEKLHSLGEAGRDNDEDRSGYRMIHIGSSSSWSKSGPRPYERLPAEPSSNYSVKNESSSTCRQVTILLTHFVHRFFGTGHSEAADAVSRNRSMHFITRSVALYISIVNQATPVSLLKSLLARHSMYRFKMEQVRSDMFSFWLSRNVPIWKRLDSEITSLKKRASDLGMYSSNPNSSHWSAELDRVQQSEVWQLLCNMRVIHPDFRGHDDTDALPMTTAENESHRTWSGRGFNWDDRYGLLDEETTEEMGNDLCAGLMHLREHLIDHKSENPRLCNDLLERSASILATASTLKEYNSWMKDEEFTLVWRSALETTKELWSYYSEALLRLDSSLSSVEAISATMVAGVHITYADSTTEGSILVNVHRVAFRVRAGDSLTYQLTLRDSSGRDIYGLKGGTLRGFRVTLTPISGESQPCIIQKPLANLETFHPTVSFLVPTELEEGAYSVGITLLLTGHHDTEKDSEMRVQWATRNVKPPPKILGGEGDVHGSLDVGRRKDRGGKNGKNGGNATLSMSDNRFLEFRRDAQKVVDRKHASMPLDQSFLCIAYVFPRVTPEHCVGMCSFWYNKNNHSTKLLSSGIIQAPDTEGYKIYVGSCPSLNLLINQSDKSVSLSGVVITVVLEELVDMNGPGRLGSAAVPGQGPIHYTSTYVDYPRGRKNSKSHPCLPVSAKGSGYIVSFADLNCHVGRFGVSVFLGEDADPSHRIFSAELNVTDDEPDPYSFRFRSPLQREGKHCYVDFSIVDCENNRVSASRLSAFVSFTDVRRVKGRLRHHMCHIERVRGEEIGMFRASFVVPQVETTNFQIRVNVHRASIKMPEKTRKATNWILNPDAVPDPSDVTIDRMPEPFRPMDWRKNRDGTYEKRQDAKFAADDEEKKGMIEGKDKREVDEEADPASSSSKEYPAVCCFLTNVLQVDHAEILVCYQMQLEQSLKVVGAVRLSLFEEGQDHHAPELLGRQSKPPMFSWFFERGHTAEVHKVIEVTSTTLHHTRHLISISNHELCVWEIDTGECVQVLEGGRDMVCCNLPIDVNGLPGLVSVLVVARNPEKKARHEGSPNMEGYLYLYVFVEGRLYFKEKDLSVLPNEVLPLIYQLQLLDCAEQHLGSEAPLVVAEGGQKSRLLVAHHQEYKTHTSSFVFYRLELQKNDADRKGAVWKPVLTLIKRTVVPQQCRGMVCVGDVVYTTYRNYLMRLRNRSLNNEDEKPETLIVDDLDSATCLQVACVREVQPDAVDRLLSPLSAQYILCIVAQGQSVAAVDVAKVWKKDTRHQTRAVHRLTVEHLPPILREQYECVASSGSRPPFDLDEAIHVLNKSVFLKVHISEDSRRMIALLDSGWAVSSCLDVKRKGTAVPFSFFKHLFVFNVNLPDCISSVFLPFESTTAVNTPCVPRSHLDAEHLLEEVKDDVEDEDDESNCCVCEVLTYSSNGEMGKNDVFLTASSSDATPVKTHRSSLFLATCSNAIKLVHFPHPFRDVVTPSGFVLIDSEETPSDTENTVPLGGLPTDSSQEVEGDPDESQATNEDKDESSMPLEQKELVHPHLFEETESNVGDDETSPLLQADALEGSDAVRHDDAPIEPVHGEEGRVISSVADLVGENVFHDGSERAELQEEEDEAKDRVEVFYTVEKWSEKESPSFMDRIIALTDGEVRGKITRWLKKTSRTQMIYRRPSLLPNIIFPLIGFFLEMVALASTSFLREFEWSREMNSGTRALMLFFQFGGVDAKMAEVAMACLSIVLIMFTIHSYHNYDHSKRLKVESSSRSLALFFVYSATVSFGSGVGLSYLTTWLLLPMRCEAYDEQYDGSFTGDSDVTNCHSDSHFIWLLPILALLPAYWYIAIRAKQSDGVAGIPKTRRWPTLFGLCGNPSEREKKLPFTGTGWTLFVSSTSPSHTRSYVVIFTAVRIANVLIATLFLSVSQVFVITVLLVSILVCIAVALWELPYASPLANTIALSSLTVIAFTNASALVAELIATGDHNRDRLALIVGIYVVCAPLIFILSMWGYAMRTYQKTETLLNLPGVYLPRGVDWEHGTFNEGKWIRDQIMEQLRLHHSQQQRVSVHPHDRDPGAAPLQRQRRPKLKQHNVNDPEPGSLGFVPPSDPPSYTNVLIEDNGVSDVSDPYALLPNEDDDDGTVADVYVGRVN